MEENGMIKMNRYGGIIVFLLSIIALKYIGDVLLAGKSLFLPVALAIFLNFLLVPVINWFESKRVPGWLSVLLTLVLTGGMFFFLGSLIKSNVESFVVGFPKYEERTSALLEQSLSLLNVPKEVFETSPSKWISDPRLSSYFQDFSLTKVISEILGSLSDFLSNAVLVLLFMVFLLSGRNQLVPKIRRAFSTELSDRIAGIIDNITQKIRSFIVAKTLLSLLNAILVMIVLWIYDVEFVIIWGLLTFLLNFIPNIGSIVATILPFTIIIIQFDSWFTILWIFIWISIIQFAIGNIIDPIYIGDSINLNPTVVLVALLFWGWIWGIIGAFLSIPIMVMLKIILENIPELRFLSILMSTHKEEKK